MPQRESGMFEVLVRWRRDVRRFRPDPIGEAEIEWLLELAHCSPSVGLSQPWRFLRILSPGLREDLAAHVDAETARAAARYDGERRALYEGLKLHGLREAPVILAAYCDDGTETGHGLGAATMPEMRRYSCAMAIHTLWLAARTRGIGMGWVSILDPAVVDGLLGVSKDWHCLGLLCLGRPARAAAEPELERQGWETRSDWRANVSAR